jgi:GNAT superfamily N-acetyltransferase
MDTFLENSTTLKIVPELAPAPILAVVSELATAPISLLSVAEAPEDLWPRGADLVAAAQAATGFPTNVDPVAVRDHTARRQAAALGVWMASATTPEGALVVGHSLLVAIAPDHPDWAEVEDASVELALADGRLVELGGLAVRPGWTRRGIAEAMVQARLTWLAERGLVGCSSVWRGSAGSTRLAERYGRRVLRRTDVASDRFVYDR